MTELAGIETDDDRAVPALHPLRDEVATHVPPAPSRADALEVEAARSAVDALYRAVLGRRPDPAGLDHFSRRLRAGVAVLDVVKELAGSPEFAARIRAAGLAEPRPAGTGFAFVITTTDPFPKIAPLVARLLAAAGEHDRVTVLTGAPAAAEERPPSDPRLAIVRREGFSVFHLRTILPEVLHDAEWLVIFEDHNIPVEGWFEAMRKATASAGPEVAVVIGVMDNMTTRSRWGWANYIATFGMAWPPIGSGEPLMPLIGNFAVRMSELPRRSFRFGAFEKELLPRIAGAALLAPGMVVDHVQSHSALSATLAHFHNARVFGGVLRLETEAFGGVARTYLADSLYGRVRRLGRRLKTHPRRHELPRFTLARVAWLNLAMGAGFLTGVMFGIGRAPWYLE